MIKISFWLIGALFIIFHNKLQKKSFKKSFMYEKIILGKKDMQD
jgi:hypothetical protein